MSYKYPIKFYMRIRDGSKEHQQFKEVLEFYGLSEGDGIQAVKRMLEDFIEVREWYHILDGEIAELEARVAEKKRRRSGGQKIEGGTNKPPTLNKAG